MQGRWAKRKEMASRQNRCFLLQAGLRSLRALLVAMLYLYCCSSSSAQEKYEMTVDPAFGRVYPADRWLPLRITLGNNSDAAVDGAVIIPIAQPTVATEFHVPVVVPAHAQVSVTAYAYLPKKALSK